MLEDAFPVFLIVLGDGYEFAISCPSPFELDHLVWQSLDEHSLCRVCWLFGKVLERELALAVHVGKVVSLSFDFFEWRRLLRQERVALN